MGAEFSTAVPFSAYYWWSLEAQAHFMSHICVFVYCMKFQYSLNIPGTNCTHHTFGHVCRTNSPEVISQRFVFVHIHFDG